MALFSVHDGKNEATLARISSQPPGSGTATASVRGRAVNILGRTRGDHKSRCSNKGRVIKLEMAGRIETDTINRFGWPRCKKKYHGRAEP